ncbi:hypothetical protein EV643_103264 [Kribbella sp. VKM Ac-2527]|uniref:Uncharacterized protein n=1 Tax=Kribbella caucasensis TaxID=2512215 RepID=A0A4R6KMA6_9ACTN|nr:hypothetical protein [Kribbella sp. VKM Ac-2527]TDO51525.1 hypothetical protein EV643_103264 [Kribbella sp. VKM Ac-2527]
MGGSADSNGGKVPAEQYVWGMYAEHTTQGRHHEAQRTGVATISLALGAAVAGLIASSDSKSLNTILSAFLVVFGIFAAVFAAKQGERARMHIRIATEFRTELENTSRTKTLSEIRNLGRDAHTENWSYRTGDNRPKSAREGEDKIRLYWLFIGLNLLVAALGLILLVWSIFM